MVAEVLFAGGRLDSLIIVAGAPIERNSGVIYDTTHADCVIDMRSPVELRAPLFTQTANVLSPTTVVTGETVYAHFDYSHRIANTVASRNLLELHDEDGYPWVALRTRNTNKDYGFFWNSGTGPSPVWTQIGADFNLTDSALFSIDVVATLGSPHTASLYLNGNLTRTGTFTQALFTEVASLKFNWPSNSGTTNTNGTISQILATRDISTVGAKVKTSRANGAGANTGWTGSFSDVNEAIGSDTNLQSAASAGLKSTHAMGDATVPVGFEIRSVFHWMRAKNDGVAPNNLRSVLRQGGVDFSTGDLSDISLGYAPVGARYDQDPSSANWTQASWNAIEAGYEAAT